LPFVLSAKTLVFNLNAKMLGLLRQSVKPIETAAEENGRDQRKESEPFLFNANSSDSSSGTGSVGNNKSIKSVVSGHLASPQCINAESVGCVCN
jgi:hypothetical protein